MSLFGQSSSKPSSPWSKPPVPEKKPSGGGWGFWESMGMRSTPKKESAGAQPPAKPSGLFGEKGYQSFAQQKEWARSKAPYEPLPGTGQKLTREERVKMIEDLERRSREAGKPYGLSEQDWRGVVKPQIEKEMYQHSVKGEIGKVQELRRKIQQYEKWIKGA